MPDDSDDDDYDGIHILYMDGDGRIHPKLTAVGDDEDDDGNKHPKLTAVDDAADDDEYCPSEGSEEEEDDYDDEDDDGNKHMYGDGDVENASEYYPSGSSQEEDDEDDNYADEDEDEAVFDEADEDLISNDAENERDVFDEVQLKLVARLQSAGLADHLASLVGGRRSLSSIKTLCNRVAR